MRTIILPRLDMNMERGQVVEWLAKEGDNVNQGEIVAKIMSEKVTYELEAPSDGILYKIIVEQGEEAPIGQVIGVMMEQGDDPTSLDSVVKEAKRSLAAPAARSNEAEGLAAPEAAEIRPKKPSGKRLKISPVARRLAEEHGIDVDTIRGTGPQGRIVKEDILKAVELKTKDLSAKVVPLVGIRRIIAERMTHSYRTIPHGFATLEIDMSKVNELREASKKRISYDAVFVKAVAKALREFPIVNSRFEEDKIVLLDDINVGVAMAREKEGLVVPVIHNADKKSLKKIQENLEELVKKGREEKLSKSDVTGGTFTISNLGVFGVDSDAVMPIINPPEIAILGIGRLREKPWVVNGILTVRPSVTCSLVADHRVVDGDVTTKFHGRIKHLLENPYILILEE